MKPAAHRIRRGLAAALLVLLAGAAGAYLARRPLTRAGISRALHGAGASDVRLRVTEVSPWRVVLDDVGLTYQRQPVTAGRVTIDRPHWWSTRLGAVRVERTSLVLAEATAAAVGPAGGREASGGSLAAALPSEFSVDGTLAVKVAEIPGGALDFSFGARENPQREWEGQLEVRAEGLSAKVSGTLRPAERRLAFRVPALRVDLAAWQPVLQRFQPLPGGPAELAGTLGASGEGTWSNGGLAAQVRVDVQLDRLALPDRKVAATGLSFEAEFTDLVGLRSRPAHLRVAELRVGELALRDVEAELAFEDRRNVSVARATFQALGGHITAEPFALRLDRAELAAVVLADGLDIEQITALARDLPAQASGRVDGRLPIRIDDTGLKFGTGWLALKPGVSAELQFNAKGLLTRGNDPRSPAYAILEQVESGLLRLKVGEMRLDVYPPNQPAGRSATLHLSGEPADPKVKAPVTLDLNVNGPLEKLISLGLDSRVGTAPAK